MALARATVDEHLIFWAGEDADEDRVGLIANLAANLRAASAPEPATINADYDSRAKSAELFAGQFIGERGVTAQGAAGSASVTYATQSETLRLIARIMGPFATGEASSGASLGYVGAFGEG